MGAAIRKGIQQEKGIIGAGVEKKKKIPLCVDKITLVASRLIGGCSVGECGSGW